MRWLATLSLLLAWLPLAEAAPPGRTASGGWSDAKPPLDLPEAALLEIAVVVFDPAGESSDAPEEARALRQAEARYVPFLLRTVLEETGSWGPVRVLPQVDPTAELLVQGRIDASEADRLVLYVRATDATGRLWIDRRYGAGASLAAYPEVPGPDPFRPLYRQIAADLADARAGLSLRELERIVEVSRLKYAGELAPRVFGDYLEVGPEGTLQINRLPAENDPMMTRIERVRDADYLFIDTVDRYYARYFREVGPTYLLWRKSRLEARQLMEAYRDHAAGRRGNGDLQRRYADFRELKLYEQTLREQLAAFSFEMGPTTTNLLGEMVELTGTAAAQYREWKDLLSRIHAAEVGLPAEDASTR